MRCAVDADVVEDLGDGVVVLDDCDEFAPAAALVTFENIYRKHALKKFGPAHSVLLFLLGRVGAERLFAFAGGDDHLVSPATLGGKLSVVAEQMASRKWYKC